MKKLGSLIIVLSVSIVTVNAQVKSKAAIISVGAGIISPSTSNKTNNHLGNLADINLGAFIPIINFAGTNTDAGNFGFTVGSEYFSGNKNYPTAGFLPLNIIGQTTDPTISAKGSGSPKQQGFKFEAGVQANFIIGPIILSPILNAGYLSIKQKSFSVIQSSEVNGKVQEIKLYKQAESNSNGFVITPALRLSHKYKFGRDNRFSFFAEGKYIMGPSINNISSSFKPNGAANAEGAYNIDQINAGKNSTQTITTNFKAFGVNVGLSAFLFKKSHDHIKAGSVMANVVSSTNQTQNQSKLNTTKSNTKDKNANDQPQNQSIINTTKSNTKDKMAANPEVASQPQNQSIVNTTKSNTKDKVVPNSDSTNQPQNQSIVNTTKSNTKDKLIPNSDSTNQPQNQSIINTTKSNTKDKNANEQPQNQSIVNTTKSNTKDKMAANPEVVSQPQNQSIINTTKSNTKDKYANDQPQNQSIVNTTKSNTKDKMAANPEVVSQPQNQSIINTTKSNTKDKIVINTDTTTQPQNQSVVSTTRSNTKDRRVANPEILDQPQNQSIINTSKSNTKDKVVINADTTSQPQNQSVVSTTRSNTKDRRMTNPDVLDQPQNQSIINTSKSNTKDKVVINADTTSQPQNQSVVSTTRSNTKDRRMTNPNVLDQPQNQSIINTSKSNTKDRTSAHTNPYFVSNGMAGEMTLLIPQNSHPIKVVNAAEKTLSNLNLTVLGTGSTLADGTPLVKGKVVMGNIVTTDANQTGYANKIVTIKQPETGDEGSALTDEAGNFVIMLGSDTLHRIFLNDVEFGKIKIENIADDIANKPGEPIGGIIVKGGRNPGGQMFTLNSNSNGEIKFKAEEIGNYQFALVNPNLDSQNKSADNTTRKVLIIKAKSPAGKVITLTPNNNGIIILNILEEGNYTLTITGLSIANK